MFHRVKSETQDSEQPTQSESATSYDSREEQRDVRSEQTTSEDRDAVSSPRSYSQPLKNEQPETKPVQGKYTMEQQTEERSVEQKSSYRPTLSRGSYAGGNTSSYGSSAPAQTSSYSAPQAPEIPTAYPSGNDRTLTIGRGINLSGEIEACDQLLVEGTVEAALKGAKVLDIAESGTFYGTVEIEEATIAGRFEGDITVNGRLTIKSTGVITGSIAYRELAVEAGAMLDGRMTPLKGQVDPKSVDNYRKGSEASAMAKSKDASGKKLDREPANAERGLFSKAHASY